MSEILPFQADSAEESANTNKGKRLPSGVVLDKDGKPCKTCTAYRDLFSIASKRPTPSLQSKLQQQQQQQALQQPAHCPPDVEVLGRATWTFLHTMAANYPESPSTQQQREVSSFISTLGRFYPCWHCADDFRSWMAKGNEPKVQSRRDFENWMCNAHNEVNKKLGKEVFDCGEESLNIRWREGPKDGSCG